MTIDALKARILGDRLPGAAEFGIPVVRWEAPQDQFDAMVTKAVLRSSTDPVFVGQRLAHIDAIVRRSAYASRFGHPSSSAGMTAAFDRTTGASWTGLLAGDYQLRRDSAPTEARSVWDVRIKGTSSSVSAVVPQGAAVTVTAASFVELPGTGHSLKLSGNATASQDGWLRITEPYDGNCVTILNALVSNPDLVSAILSREPELMRAVKDSSLPVEDRIAAFMAAFLER